ncbi:MAG TPA: PHP domain-containing protein [Candidatus Acidoferrum sp.]|nr:PHP domain-containing protein [Candidatus Acidoferrum sp.]
MKKILILTASFGDGHNAAARNLRDALELITDDAKVEVLDLFESTYGTLNSLLKQTYQGLVRFAPTVWSGVFSVFDSPVLFRRQTASMGRLRDALGTVLHDAEPDVVVSCYPVYSHIIQDIFRDHAERPFRFITVVTDAITVCSAWYRAPSDLFVVSDDATREVLATAGVPKQRVKALGFPVSPVFAREQPAPLTAPQPGERRKVLYVINTGKAKAGKSITRLLKIPDLDLTITVGRDATLKARLTERLREYGDRVRVYGWTNQMPRLLMSHHLVIAKAGGAMIQEAIAARCPMIINQVIPGQEEGNAKLIAQLGVGAVAEKGKEVRDLVQEVFAHKSRKWQEWRENLQKVSHPDAAIRLAELVLEEAGQADHGPAAPGLFEPTPSRNPGTPNGHPGISRMLLCDFHIHTNYSDGRLTLPEVIDFYGRRGFDCICITDHVADPRRLIGKFSELLNFTVAVSQLDEYFDMLERERRRAWRKYEMLVMTGLEFNKEGFTRKTSGHLLGIDLKAPISPSLGFVEIVAQIHSQGGLAVAAHPHVMKSEWGKNTLFLWENQEVFAPILDAWEIANRNNIFAPVGLKRLAFLANSDFHKPKHIYSWKTLLHCEKDPEAIKDCIRRNEHVSLTLYRDGIRAESLRAAPQVPEIAAREMLALQPAMPAVPA